MFVYEFGDSAYIIKAGNQVAAYLFGFISQTEPSAYVHLVGVREPYRRRGLARRLYDHFVRFAIIQGCTELKAITTPSNKESIAFHRSLGDGLDRKTNREAFRSSKLCGAGTRSSGIVGGAESRGRHVTGGLQRNARCARARERHDVTRHSAFLCERAVPGWQALR